MALTKQIENDKIEVVTSLKAIQIRQKTTILEDGKALSSSFHRRCIEPGYIDASNNYVKSDISSEDAEIKAIANAVWTDAVHDAKKTQLLSLK
tara:strand:+ start:989 stop:1267 length:279 start_codon:yes stop_codon:yes gene_type:complete